MKISVCKFDPSKDAAPYYVSGEVPYKERMTALEALVHFHENISAINFDYSCACRLCGRCSVMMDGEPVLACVTPIEDADHVFDPLKGFTVIRDLVVDKTSYDNQLSRLYDRVRVEPFNEKTIVPENYDPTIKDMLYTIEFCNRCGACDASCPAKQAYPDEYVGPAGMLAIGYRYLDPLDQGDRVMEAVSKGLFRCIQCGKCDEVCAQQDINHAEMWKILRKAAEERGIVPSYAK